MSGFWVWVGQQRKDLEVKMLSLQPEEDEEETMLKDTRRMKTQQWDHVLQGKEMRWKEPMATGSLGLSRGGPARTGAHQKRNPDSMEY